MTYLEKLAKAKEITPKISELMVAWEVECQLGSDRPDFEEIVSVADDMYMDIDGCSITQIVDALGRVMDGKELDKITTQDVIDNIAW